MFVGYQIILSQEKENGLHLDSNNPISLVYYLTADVFSDRFLMQKLPVGECGSVPLRPTVLLFCCYVCSCVLARP